MSLWVHLEKVVQSAGVSNVHFRDFLGTFCHNGIEDTNKISYTSYIYGDNTGLLQADQSRLATD